MFDNIKLSLNLNTFFTEDRRLLWINEIKEKFEKIYGHTEDYLCWKIRNMKFRITSDRLVIHGSIAKFINNENCTPLNRSSVEKAIHLLEDEIGINLKNAKVIYCEFGPSLIVKEIPGKYLSFFGWPPNLSKSVNYSNSREITTITYKSKTGYQEFILYNKINEMLNKRAKQNIPEFYAGKNVVRLEYKIKNLRGINEKFGRELSAYDLFDVCIYQKFQNLFFEFYNSIEKCGRAVNFQNPKTPKQFRDNFCEFQRQMHPDEYNEYHRAVKESGVMPDKTLSRIRTEDRKRSKNTQISDTAPLIEELDKQVNEAFAYDDGSVIR
jgi:hypothetical protein